MITDNMMMPAKHLGVGLFYGYDSWKHYWEGALKRDNGNVGILITQNVTFMTAYGVNDKLTLIAMVPYVWTRAGGGTLHGMKGIQDVTLSGKYNFFKKDFEQSSLRLFGLGTASMPASNYTADFMPLSIGMACVNLSYRMTADFTYKKWFFTGSGAYTWRSNIFLDRPGYYTNGQLFSTNEVKMPNTFDFIFRAGFRQSTWQVDAFYTQQNTLGGGDIERQNTPFVSDRMNAQKIGFSALWFESPIKNCGLRLWGDYTVAGRNVGQSAMIMGGAMYRLNFSKNQ